MSPSVDPPTADEDPRLLRAVREYLNELEAGRPMDRAAVAQRFPDLAEAMAPYLDALDIVHAAAPALRQSGQGQAPQAAAPAEPLGDFRIVREIGRGGMGVVYEAIQLSLGRKVALKVLPTVAALDGRQLQRFKNEAQAAAQLHHTNIVPVHAVGVERGVHFYAMQLIEGQDLASILDELRDGKRPERPATESGQAQPVASQTLSTRPRAQLSTQYTSRVSDFFRTAARLAVQAAEALDYAHGMDIVHRDIKPANLIVDERGTLWITDFGLAQFHADANLTRTGDLVGTMRYMSPEQAGGQRFQVDHRTDIYSLGATLYELLTLRPIFDGADRQTVLRQVLNDEPAPLRSVNAAIPAELETIVQKAVAKAPTDRYATARELADDLNRFLRHEPILARRPTLFQRGRKWLRRHPSVIAAGVVLLLMLTAGSLVAAWLIEGEKAKERLRAEQAEERFRLARRAVDELIEIATEELADKPMMEGVRKRLLLSALTYYGDLLEQRREDPHAQADLSATRASVKKALDDLVLLEGAWLRTLLKSPAVLDDLALSQDKREEVGELSRKLDARMGEVFMEFGRLKQQERSQRFLAVARENEAALAEVLSPGQVRRLRQIALQNKGPSAFRDADVARELELTAQQRAQVRTIEAEAFAFGPTDGPRPGGHGPGDHRPGDRGPGSHSPVRPNFDEMRRAHEQRRAAAMERILALLSPTQLKKWRQMTGEPFAGSAPFFPPFGPPPGNDRPPGPPR